MNLYSVNLIFILLISNVGWRQSANGFKINNIKSEKDMSPIDMSFLDNLERSAVIDPAVKSSDYIQNADVNVAVESKVNEYVNVIPEYGVVQG